MGNCQCLGPEEDKSEFNVNFKDKKYNHDYDHGKAKGKAIDDNFQIVEDD